MEWRCCCFCCAAQILLDVARSLEHVHRMSLLHCDLKPDNVSMASVAASCCSSCFGVVLHVCFVFDAFLFTAVLQNIKGQLYYEV